jgi:hypothetical protein
LRLFSAANTMRWCFRTSFTVMGRAISMHDQQNFPLIRATYHLYPAPLVYPKQRLEQTPR